jgi:preprotein translocase subunit SecA
MSIISKVLGLFLGNKYERDMKEILPFVEATKIEFEKLGSLSNDELRNVTLRLKSEIQEYIKGDQEEILKLKELAAQEPDFSKKEEIYNQSDKLTKSVDTKIEEVLEKVLPTGICHCKGDLKTL